MTTRTKPCKGLMERLNDGENVLIAEGYLFEFERRGYAQQGAWVPEVVLERPDLVQEMHREFVHAGSDVVQAYTYYALPEKLETIGRQDEIEKLNRTAMRLAREVAYETGCLFAGDIGGTTAYVPDDPKSHELVSKIFEQQVKWAVEEGVDYMVGETMYHVGEALLLMEAIKQHGNGMPAVMTLTAGVEETTFDGVPIGEAARQLEEAGAAVVGLNCQRGPQSIISPLKKVKQAVKIPVAALPVCFRTSEESALALWSLKDAVTGENAWPEDLDPWACSRSDIRKFGEECKKLGIQYVGLCCGNCSHYTRTLAETMGRKPPASKYSPDNSLSTFFGNTGSASNEYNRLMKEQLK